MEASPREQYFKMLFKKLMYIFTVNDGQNHSYIPQKQTHDKSLLCKKEISIIF